LRESRREGEREAGWGKRFTFSHKHTHSNALHTAS
jgi:hypothetical protein